MIDFYGIGAQRTGTTWLAERLLEHPEVFFPPRKELHYWDVNFPHKTIKEYLSVFPNNDKKKGEITPAYAILEPGKVDMVSRIWPELKIFYTIRNPFQRVWSHLTSILYKEKIKLKSLSKFELQRLIITRCMDRSNYENSIKTWRAFFPDDQILILLYDELCSSPIQYYNKILSHIEVSPVEKVNANPTHSFTEHFLSVWDVKRHNELFDYLSILLLDDIDSLATYLKKDLSAWKDPKNYTLKPSSVKDFSKLLL